MGPTELKLAERGETPHRRSEDLVATDDMPWQARAIALIGVPSAIACFLVWFLTQTVSPALKEISADQKAHGAATVQLGTTLQQLEQDHRDSNARIESYMRLMCVQAAKTPVDRHDCLSIQ